MASKSSAEDAPGPQPGGPLPSPDPSAAVAFLPSPASRSWVMCPDSVDAVLGPNPTS